MPSITRGGIDHCFGLCRPIFDVTDIATSPERGRVRTLRNQLFFMLSTPPFGVSTQNIFSTACKRRSTVSGIRPRGCTCLKASEAVAGALVSTAMYLYSRRAMCKGCMQFSSAPILVFMLMSEVCSIYRRAPLASECTSSVCVSKRTWNVGLVPSTELPLGGKPALCGRTTHNVQNELQEFPEVVEIYSCPLNIHIRSTYYIWNVYHSRRYTCIVGTIFVSLGIRCGVI